MRTLAALLPQQALLTLSAYAAVSAITAAHYGDGLMRPRVFILADQAPAMIALVLHTAALIEMHAHTRDGELLRIIHLFRERGPAAVQDLLATVAGPIAKQDTSQRAASRPGQGRPTTHPRGSQPASKPSPRMNRSSSHRYPCARTSARLRAAYTSADILAGWLRRPPRVPHGACPISPYR